jgi:tRNA (Thr-GGU) A37 N-methylase
VYIDGMKVRGLFRVEFYDAWDEFPYVDIKLVPTTINAEKEKAEEKEIKFCINGQSIAQCSTEALDK